MTVWPPSSKMDFIKTQQFSKHMWQQLTFYKTRIC